MRVWLAAIITFLTLILAPGLDALGTKFESDPSESRIVIAIIDAGLDSDLAVERGIANYLCKSGHISYVSLEPFTDDHTKHGTNIAGLLVRGLDPAKYCILILRFYHRKAKDGHNILNVARALEHSRSMGASYVNLSLNGERPSKREKKALRELLRAGAKVAVAAGNERANLDKKCVSFPACYTKLGPNYRIIGSRTGTYSNYGRIITHWEDGTNKGYPAMRGTSQATAIHMNKWIKEGAK